MTANDHPNAKNPNHTASLTPAAAAEPRVSVRPKADPATEAAAAPASRPPRPRGKERPLSAALPAAPLVRTSQETNGQERTAEEVLGLPPPKPSTLVVQGVQSRQGTPPALVVLGSRRAPAAVRFLEPKTTPLHVALLVGVCILALAVRLKDPLSHPMIGAEDPYGHMERTWDLIQGEGLGGYPPGLTVLMAPFAVAGAAAFYTAAQFVPAFLGAAMALGMFFLCRRYTHPSGALVASVLVALMPETIRRSDVLFPTAVDLAVLPWLFLALLSAAEGRTRALLPAGLLGVAVLVTHPWGLALLLPSAAVLFLVESWRRKLPYRKAYTLGFAAGTPLVLGLLALGLFPLLNLQAAGAKLGAILANPGSLAQMPPFVDLPSMLTIGALLLAGVGTGVAFVRRTSFATFALLWTFSLLPLALVDWFGVWFLPHRVVAYLALGVAMLAALPVSELFRAIAESRPRAQGALTFGAVALALLVALPPALATDPWYRLYSAEDREAWEAIHERNEPVLTASWEARVGYRGTTGGQATYMPDFFTSEAARQSELERNPTLIVLVDQYAVKNGVPLGFLSDWQQVGAWGTTAAYTR